MKIIGIVSEYNPFHKGHLYQIEKSKSLLNATGVVAVMSGNFVQRGYPAIYDKWLRAEMAVKNGVNLVLELPTYYATSSAEQFAKGAVSLLNQTDVVTHLSFGSEYDDLETLDQIAELLIHPSSALTEALNAALDKGMSFPVARSLALLHVEPSLKSRIDLNQSNVILGIEYLKSLKQLNSNIEPFLVKRQGSGYHDLSLDSPFVSATAIRKLLLETPEQLFAGDWVPKSVLDVIKKTTYMPTHIECFEKIILYALRKTSPYELSQIKEVSEGLENKLIRAGMTSQNYQELVEAVKSKRYTLTRINRILLNLLLDIKPLETSIEQHGYFRVLAFDDIGQKIIRTMKKTSSLPVITNINKHSDFISTNPLIQLDIKATQIYQLGQNEVTAQRGSLDHLKQPFQLSKTN